MSDTWTIGELAEHAARALRDGAPPPANGRVRDVPGERLIRWYTTIGLVDPPLTRRGRTARYGRRHLLQLVAVKRLQAAGRSIAEIQTALAGATDRMLESAAHLEHPPAPKAATLRDNPSPAGPPPDSASRGTSSSDSTSLDATSPDSTSSVGTSPGSVSSDAASLDGSSLEDGSVDGAYPDAAYPDAAYPDAAYPDAAYPDAAYPDAAYPDAA
ncbi:helix-turn-helix domain-containing protein, partial [Nonomuraea fuscirosea]|uniref:helix-turn-helix domain-containing protein n=1 Tax=Nonomuraea fuscirosea TaxID=1291556 RepID=UPI00341CBD40